MFYVVGQHRQAMIDEEVRRATKRGYYGKLITQDYIERTVDNAIIKGKTIKLTGYYSSPAPALKSARLARKDGAKKVSIKYFYFVGTGKDRKKKTGTYTSESSFRAAHNFQPGLI